MKLLFFFLLTVASLSAFAQQTIKISGRVTDFNDKPISNCTVMLMDGRFNAIDSVVTDSVGFYLMNGPMSATEAMKYDEKLYRDNNNGVIDYSVKLEDFQVQAFIDDREVKIRHIANTTEQYGNQKMGAFILMLDYNVRHDDRTVHKITKKTSQAIYC